MGIPRLLQDAFQALLNVTERNFAALTLPAGTIHTAVDKSDGDSNRGSVFGRAIGARSRALAYFYQPIIFDEKFFAVTHFLTARCPEIGGVIELVLPVSRVPKSVAWRVDRSSAMETIRRLNESNEPMEIEEISYTESIGNFEHVIKREKIEEVEILEVPSNAIKDLRPKVILRKSKLAGNLATPSSIETANLPRAADEHFKDAEKRRFSKNSEAYTKSKAKLRPLVRKEEAEKSNAEKTSYLYLWQLLFFVLFSIAVTVMSATIARKDFLTKSCAQHYNATGAIMELKNRVFGQAEAIRELSEHLALESGEFKVLAIIGGSGVGKSYVAHIISENFQPQENLFHYVQPLEPLHGRSAVALSFCGCNLIVLENLGNKDISAGADFVRQIKNTAGNCCVLVIEIINVQETDDNLRHAVDLAKSKSKIESIYENDCFDVKVIVFEPLGDEVINKCILEAAQNRNITLSDSDIDYVRLGLRIADSGCKGAHAKVQLLDGNTDV